MSWDEEDLELALAWQAELDGQCGGCGQPLDESSDPANSESYAGKTLVCHACAAMDRVKDDLAEVAREHPAHVHGGKVYVLRDRYRSRFDPR